jgi:hypothetical protein
MTVCSVAIQAQQLLAARHHVMLNQRIHCKLLWPTMTVRMVN